MGFLLNFIQSYKFIIPSKILFWVPEILRHPKTELEVYCLETEVFCSQVPGVLFPEIMVFPVQGRFWRPSFFHREELGTLTGSSRYIYQHIPHIYGLYNGCIGRYGVIFGEQLLGYPPKGTHNFPLNFWMIYPLVRTSLLGCYTSRYDTSLLRG